MSATATISAAVRTWLLVAAGAVSTACVAPERLPALATHDGPDGRVCAEGETMVCERFSTFMWGHCDCVSHSRR